METVSSNTNSAGQTTEIYIKKILPGNIESVRRQLAGALGYLDYDIIEDEPQIVARCGARGWGTWYGSADVLDYARTLTIRLKAVSENSTRATFDYSINHPMLSKGERNVLVQEAKTIAEISKKQAIEKICAVCETESNDDTRFCRKCGAPLTSEQTEIEVLRMLAEIRAAKTSVVSSAVFMIVSMILLIITLILNNTELLKPRVLVLLLLLSGAGILIAVLSTFFGWNRLKRALGKPVNQVQYVPRNAPESLETGEFYELPERKPITSVTEGTTNLLDEEWTNRRKKEKIRVSNRRDTNNFE